MPPSLKQRLAALSLAPSSPTSPLSPTNLRKPFQHPWKRASQDASPTQPDARGRVQQIMPKVIFQAGVDFETRPMVIISASALPDPAQVSYDILLSRILSYLDLYVESDYTVVFFAAGGRHAPSWNWVWKAYRSLSRKYRKNLKRLYIIHSSFFSKMLFSLAGAIISPKFFQKIVYIDTLSQLAHHVPLTQIDVPPAVYQENLKRERQISMPMSIRASVFGVPLEELMGCDGEKSGLPRVVKDSIQYIRESGLNEEGLFRRSPNSALLKQVQQAYDRGQVVSLETFDDPHLASVLIKKFLRDLPNPPFPESLYPVIRQCPTVSNDLADMAAVTYIRDTLLPQLIPCVYILFSHILHLLHEVSLHSSTNLMDAHNLAIVISPNLVKGSNPMRDVMMCAVPGGPLVSASDSPSLSSSSAKTDLETGTTLGSVVKLCIQRYYEIFDEVKDRSEPVSASMSSSSARRFSQSPSPLSSSESLGSNSNSLSWSSLSRSAKLGRATGDDEDSIDDAMLVMPIGPPPPGNATSSVGDFQAPNLMTTMKKDAGAIGPSVFPYQPRQRRKTVNAAANAATTPVESGGVSNPGSGFNHTNNYASSRGRARSTLSIEKIGNGTGNGSGVGSGRGSISIGRGGSFRKASGSGVETLGVTAGGFLTPPSGSQTTK